MADIVSCVEAVDTVSCVTVVDVFTSMVDIWLYLTVKHDEY